MMIKVGFSHWPTGKSSKTMSSHTIYGNTQSSFDLLTVACFVVQQRAEEVNTAKSEQVEDKV